MPEPITLTILAFLAKKKLAVAGAKALAGGASTAAQTGVSAYVAAHSATIAAIAGSVILSAVLSGIAVALAKLVEGGIKSKAEAKKIMDGAKQLPEEKQKALKGELEGMLEKYGL